ncbi:MAG: hypothetical protein LBK58_10485 [Prevotellaceae bacterium]|nr:hypothetical protein [Prevotellaceae bacterium]
MYDKIVVYGIHSLTHGAVQGNTRQGGTVETGYARPHIPNRFEHDRVSPAQMMLLI